MKTSEFNKIFWCCTLLAVLVLCGKAYSKTVEDLVIDELAGRNDPFAIVRTPKTIAGRA